MRLLLQKECTGLGGLQIIMVFLLPMLALVKDSLEVLYTEDVSEFKADRYNARLETVVGCWIMTDEYLKFRGVHRTAEHKLPLIKQCMKKITRKDSVLKITELIGKNKQPARKYSDIVGQQDIEELQSSNRVTQQQASLVSQSEFDAFLLGLVQNYERQMEEFNREGLTGESLQKKVESQLKKREKYYFGVIPANGFTHVVLLITISLMLVCCCTCYSYYRSRSDKNLRKKSEDKSRICWQAEAAKEKTEAAKEKTEAAKEKAEAAKEKAEAAKRRQSPHAERRLLKRE